MFFFKQDILKRALASFIVLIAVTILAPVVIAQDFELDQSTMHTEQVVDTAQKAQVDNNEEYWDSGAHVLDQPMAPLALLENERAMAPSSPAPQIIEEKTVFQAHAFQENSRPPALQYMHQHSEEEQLVLPMHICSR